MTARTIKVKALTRVEGEGGLYIRLNGENVEDVRLEIYEPPRLFESFLRGRVMEDVPDITARICGICPVAYQMSSVHALEAALGIQVTSTVRGLRRLLYCGEWIESHTLHMYLLNAPDFLGFESGLEMAEKYPEQVNRGLRMKKIGNQLLEVLGGRAIHPVNVCVGGFYRLPRTEELQRLLPDLEWCLQAAMDTTRWVAQFDFPDFTRDYQMVSLCHDEEYPMNEGDIATSHRERIRVANFEDEFEEIHVEHSTALHARRTKTAATYLCGPLPRVNLNLDRLAPAARRVMDELKIDWPCLNPFQSIVARGLELIHAYAEALQIIREYSPLGPPRAQYEYRQAEGCAATEAPRGLLYHRYQVDDRGKIVMAKIVPPTSQNQAQIESDLRVRIPFILSSHESDTARQCENLVRCYDPCISCSTHFLNVEMQRHD